MKRFLILLLEIKRVDLVLILTKEEVSILQDTVRTRYEVFHTKEKDLYAKSNLPLPDMIEMSQQDVIGEDCIIKMFNTNDTIMPSCKIGIYLFKTEELFYYVSSHSFEELEHHYNMTIEFLSEYGLPEEWRV